MRLKEYLVTKRDRRWCVFCGAVQHGPYISRQIAINSALAMAKADFSEMKSAMVMLEEEGQMEPLYDSTSELPLRLAS